MRVSGEAGGTGGDVGEMGVERDLGIVERLDPPRQAGIMQRAEFLDRRVAALGTDATWFSGFDLGLSFTYGAASLTFEFPVLWSYGKDRFHSDVEGLTGLQIAGQLQAFIGFKL